MKPSQMLRWKKALAAIAGLLLCANIAAIGGALMFRLEAAIAGEGYMWYDRLYLNSGRAALGRAEGAWFDGQTCQLIRIATQGCPYCQRDLPIWQSLRQKAEAAGCHIYVIPPTYETGAGRGPHASLANEGTEVDFVPAAFAGRLRAWAGEVPTTILVDSNGYVRWSNVGAMSPVETETALKEIDAMRNVKR